MAENEDDEAAIVDFLDAANFEIHEVTESEIENWLHSEFHGTHPDELVRATFPERIMAAISNDHHKSRDGVLTISYDYYAKEWFITHPGYVRDAEARAGSYLEAASSFLEKIRTENGHVLYGAIAAEANKRLAPEYSVEIEENSMTLYECRKGENRPKTLGSYDVEGKSVDDVVAQINEWITAKY